MENGIPFEHITTAEGLADFCNRSQNCKFIGFDTEFVSENRYRPELCLLQVAADGEYAIIDTLAVKDVTPFWNLLAEGPHVTVAHAAREEFLFCLLYTSPSPRDRTRSRMPSSA